MKVTSEGPTMTHTIMVTGGLNQEEDEQKVRNQVIRQGTATLDGVQVRE